MAFGLNSADPNVVSVDVFNPELNVFEPAYDLTWDDRTWTSQIMVPMAVMGCQ